MGKKAAFLFSFILIGMIAFHFYEKYDKSTGRFYVDYVTSEMTFQPEWEIPTLTKTEEKQLNAILNQTFHYIGKGGQAYAFESQDGQYVLKFLKFKYLRPRLSETLISFIPFFEDKKANEMQRRKRKFYDLYRGYKSSYDYLRETTGLLFIHFNPTFGRFGSQDFFDKRGKKHSIDIDQVVFILQKKGELLNKVVATALDQKDFAKAKDAIFKTLEMYLKHYEKGFYDRDYGVMHNAGLTSDGPIHIDLGKITYSEKIKEKSYQKEDLLLVINDMMEWLQKNYPQFLTEFKNFIQEKFSFL